MIAVLYNGSLWDLPWIWGNVLRPTDRFMQKDFDGSSVRCCISDSVVTRRLMEYYIFDLELEAIRTDPEWPCQYWEQQKELRGLWE